MEQPEPRKPQKNENQQRLQRNGDGRNDRPVVRKDHMERYQPSSPDGKPACTFDDIEKEIQGMGLGAANRFMVRWMFHNTLLKNAYSGARMEATITQAPFKEWRVEVSGVGFMAWMKKQKESWGSRR